MPQAQTQEIWPDRADWSRPFKALAAVGWSPIGLMVLETAWIAILVPVVVKVFV